MVTTRSDVAPIASATEPRLLGVPEDEIIDESW